MAFSNSIIINSTGEGEDYDSGPYRVKFNPGMTEVALDVSIVDDNVLEGNENFNLTVNISSLPSRVNVGDPGQATVTIVDDDDGNVYTVIGMFITVLKNTRKDSSLRNT